MDERINKLVDEATSGLCDDRELCLDVRKELATHLERTAADFQQEGKSEEESVEQALKVFGAPAELAGELLDANKRRMKLRSLARLTIRAFVIPAAFILALWVGYANYMQITSLYTMVRFVDALSGSINFYPATKPSVGSQIIMKGFDILPKRPFDDDFSKLNTTDIPGIQRSMPAIAKNNPTNKVYWGYYSNGLFGEAKDESIFDHGMNIDPDNALYHYLRASEYLQQAMGDPKSYGNGNKMYEYIVKDPILMKKGIQEIAAGMACPYLNSYHKEVMLKRLSRLPKPYTLKEYSQLMMLVGAEPCPEFGRYRELSRKMPFCARYLAARGQDKEAEIPLLFPARMADQLANSSDSLIGLHVAKAIARMGADLSVTTANRIERKDIALKLMESCKRFDQAMPEMKWDNNIPEQIKIEREFMSSHSGMMAKIMLPATGGLPSPAISEADLAPTRYLDYWLMDRIGAGLLLSFLTVLMVGSLLVWLYWFFVAGKARKSFILLLPSWKMFANIFCYGLLLPLVIYFVYSRIPALSGRDYNLAVNANRALLEQLVLMLSLLLFPGVLAGRYLKKRCISLGIAVPKGKFKSWPVVALTVIILFCVWVEAKLIPEWMGPNWILLLIVLLFSAIVVSFIGILYCKLKTQNKPYAIYRGTLAGSLVPVYAIAIILLTLITQPYLAHREVQLLKEDKLIFMHGNEVGMSPIENAVVENIKAKLFPEGENGK